MNDTDVTEPEVVFIYDLCRGGRPMGFGELEVSDFAEVVAEVSPNLGTFDKVYEEVPGKNPPKHGGWRTACRSETRVVYHQGEGLHLYSLQVVRIEQTVEVAA